MVLLGGKTNVEEAREVWWAAYNGTGEVLLNSDIPPALSSLPLLQSYKLSSSSTIQPPLNSIRSVLLKIFKLNIPGK